ncbi:MAG: electron transfer flavoprotein subunit alpha, partial [Chloroflexi bacterium]|nr:electron transfer flavoprotein subunit alpha [Chloroflexota bacterium]
MMRPAYAPEEARGIWVFLERDADRLAGVSLELLGKGRELAAERGVELVGLLLGHGVDALAHEALRAGADWIVLADHPLLETYSTDGYTAAADQAIREGRPEVFLLGATPNGRDLAGRLAVRLWTGLTADCTGLG